MSEKHTIRKSLEDRREGQTDWKRIDRLTDEEIRQAVATDPDAQLLAEDWFQMAELMVPST